MNENKYLYFIKIHELGSITKAAESLYISQPALSKYIRNLERGLGVSLVEREYSPVRFTEAGEIYFRYAKEALKNYDKMRRDIAEAGISLSKTFTFDISTDLTKYFTKDIVKPALEEDRDLDINVVEDTSLNMEKLIENGSVDVGFFGTDIINNEALDYMSIKKDMLWLVCGKGNPRLKDRDVKEVGGRQAHIFSCFEIPSLPFCSRERNYKLADMVDRYISGKGIAIKDDLKVSDIYTMYCLVKDTNRFAFLPNFFISGNGLTDDVALCSVDGDAFPIFIVLARAKNRPLSGKDKKLVRAIRDFTDNSGI